MPKNLSNKAKTISDRPKLRRLNYAAEVEELIGQSAWKLAPLALMEQLATKAVTQLGLSCCAFWTVNQDSNTLEMAVQVGKLSFPPTLLRTSSAAPPWATVLTQETPHVFSVDPEDESELVSWGRENHLPFLAAYPLLQDSNAKGLMMVAGAKPSAPIQSLLRLYARMASVSLHDSELRAFSVTLLNRLGFLTEASRALGPTLDLEEVFSRILDVSTRAPSPSAGRSWPG